MAYTDRDIVQALLQRDEHITREFLYRTCYPLFKSVYDNYHTDCSSCIEFISEIYVHMLTPSATTGQCKLQQFAFQSTLFTWLKTVCLYYCYKRFEHHSRHEKVQIVEKFNEQGVRIDNLSESLSKDEDPLSASDVETILALMPNKRYSQLMRYRYVEDKTNEETAALLGMNMNTYYVKHKSAKEQYMKILKQEEQYES